MIADGGDGDRAIINTDYSLGTGIVVKGIFDGTAPGSSAVLSLGAWHSVQVEVTYNTGPANSVLKVWVDTDTYASPTFTVSAVAVVPSSSGDATYGRYSNDTLASGGQFIFRESAFRIATTFDSNWNGWLSSSSSSTAVSGNVSFTGSVRIQ